MTKHLLLLTLSLACLSAHGQKFDNLALTPPMGWNSWNKFQTNINEQVIRDMADAMAANGMKDAGYQYINLDDCWQGQRDAQGFIRADPVKFPSGIKALAAYVHSKGLKLGIYSDAGSNTCAGYPASRGHEYQDAMMYAKWDVDYLKYDWCGCDDLVEQGAYATMRDALHAAGRPIVFSMCEWGKDSPWLWAKDLSHLWRTTADIGATFAGTIDHVTWQQWGILRIIDAQKTIRQYSGPGHWNDPDMLEVGNGMTESEDRAHFSMWCMLAAPLISGNDLAHMADSTLKILVNKDAIALDQDPLGIEGFVYAEKDGVETWFKPLSNGDWGMCVLNRNLEPKHFTFDWKNEPVRDSLSKRDADFGRLDYSWRNAWANDQTGTTSEMLSANVPGHDVLLLRLRLVTISGVDDPVLP